MNYELKHYGILGMKWGIRRTPEQLGRRVSKLTEKNDHLSSYANKQDTNARKYEKKSFKYEKSNSKYQRRFENSAAKKAKYDYKIERQLHKKNPNSNKISKYVNKSSKYNKRMLKAQSKLKYNKWTIKSDEAREAAKRARETIAKNDNLMRVYNQTISSINAGTIRQGKIFMRYEDD